MSWPELSFESTPSTKHKGKVVALDYKTSDPL